MQKEVSKNKEWRRIENPDDYRATFRLYKLVEQDENSTESLEPVNDKETVSGKNGRFYDPFDHPGRKSYGPNHSARNCRG